MYNDLLWTALITPFNQDLSIDKKSLINLIRRQNGLKIGVLLFGSTGESLSLSQNEMKEVVELVCKEFPNQKVMVNIKGINLEENIDMIEFCNHLPIYGFLLTTPLYSKPGEAGQTMWFEKLMNKSTKPTMLYNIPGRSAVSLHINTIKNLISHINFFGVKDSSGSTSLISNSAKLGFLSCVKFFCGDDGLMFEFEKFGAVGLISVASNIWPKEVLQYLGQILEKKYKHPSQFESPVLFSPSNPIPTKALLHKIGLIETPNLRPPLTQMDLLDIAPLIRMHEEVIKDKE